MGCAASVQVMPYSTVQNPKTTNGIVSSEEVRFHVNKNHFPGL